MLLRGLILCLVSGVVSFLFLHVLVPKIYSPKPASLFSPQLFEVSLFISLFIFIIYFNYFFLFFHFMLFGISIRSILQPNDYIRCANKYMNIT